MPQKSSAARPEPSKGTPGTAGASTMQIILIVLAVVLVAAIIIFLVMHFSDGKDNVQGPKDTRATVVSQDNAQVVKESIDKPVVDGAYHITMNMSWVFSNESSDAYVENAKDNTRTVYFDVFRSDTNELIYSSPYIPVGEKIQNFVLSSPLAAGNYKGLVTYHLVDDDHKEVSNLSVTVNIQVK